METVALAPVAAFGKIGHAWQRLLALEDEGAPPAICIPPPTPDRNRQEAEESVANGITLPPHVIEQIKREVLPVIERFRREAPLAMEQLEREGIPLERYSLGELQDAVIACAYDAQLIDDPDDNDFHGRLTLTAGEARKKNPFGYSNATFCEQEAERQQKCRYPAWHGADACDASGGDL